MLASWWPALCTLRRCWINVATFFYSAGSYDSQQSIMVELFSGSLRLGSAIVLLLLILVDPLPHSG